MFNNLAYYIIYGWVYLHALLPFWALYILSDILYVIAYYIIGYRKKVVRKNLKNSFPDKSEAELRKIEKGFYRHFGDYIVETIKLLHISDKEIQRRLRFIGLEKYRDEMEKGQSFIMFMGHYGNWEWVPSITLNFDKNNKYTLLAQIYRPLSNKVFDRLFLKLRSRFGSISIAKNDTLRSIVRLKKEGKHIMIGFISDQTPSLKNIHYWTTFLHQETAVLTGGERIARQTGYKALYMDVIKTGRGKYECHIKLLSDNPKDEPEFAITEKYIREFEKQFFVLLNIGCGLTTDGNTKE